MAKITEPLSGGMVTSRDPSLLAPGELQNAYNCIYLQDYEHLTRIPGASTMASALYWQRGIVPCRFTNGRHDLITMQQYTTTTNDMAAYLVSSAESNSGTPYTGKLALATGSSFIGVMSDNRHYLFNGANENLVYLSDGTFRPHGLLPAKDGDISFYRWMDDGTPSAEFHTSSCAVTATGYYEYWFTECLTFSDGQVLESTFAKKPLTVNVTSLSTAPVLNLPSAPQNLSYAKAYSAKLHFNIYRSEKKTAINDIAFPIGRKVGEASWVDTAGGTISRPIFKDTATVAHTGVKYTSSLVGTLADKGVYNTSTTFTTTLVATPSAGTITSALGSSSDSIRIQPEKGSGGWHDGTTGSWPTNRNIYDNMPAKWAIGLRGFSFGTFDGNILGIDVTVRARASIANYASIVVMPCVFNADGTIKPHPAEGGSPATPGGLFNVGIHPWGTEVYSLTNFPGNAYTTSNKSAQSKAISSTSWTSYNFGQLNTDTNAPNFISYPYTWKQADVGDYFGVVVAVVFNKYDSVATWVDIDYISMDLYYNSAGTEDANLKDKKGQYFEAVTVEQEGVQVSFGARNKGPVASTATMFQGSMVTDAVDEPNKIYYSLPGFPDAFPKEVYWIELPGVNNEKITSINVVNDRLVVGTRGSLWRVNYLPSQDDAGFDRGAAISLLSGSMGIVNQNAACVFTSPDGRQELAFVDANGVFSTDGYNIRKLSQDLLWVGPASRAVMGPNSTVFTYIVGLINDPRTQTIRLITGGAGWAGSYAAIHAKEGGGLKWTKYAASDSYGTVTSAACVRRNSGAWVVVYGVTKPTLVDGQYEGRLLREDSTDSTTYNDVMNGQNPVITTREITMGGLSNESSVDSIGIHGILRSAPNSAVFTNVGAEVTTQQRFTNAAGTTAATTVVPGGISGSRMSMAGIDGVNCEELSLTFTLLDTSMFDIHAVQLNVTDFGEADTSA